MEIKDFFAGGKHWRNWVGNQSCIRQEAAAPECEQELSELVAGATSRGLKVRCAGSGHSFTPVALTNGLHLTLSKMSGVTAIDHEAKRVTASAGTTIRELVAVLKENGLSMINQGDIDSQGLAGALTTGTHGTGANLANLASSVVGMKLVQPDGSIRVVDERVPDELLASRVSLGTLGVISELTLQVEKSYNLYEKIWRDDFEDAMAKHDELAASHRHFAFFWCPTRRSHGLYCLPDTTATSRSGRWTDVCEMKVMDKTDEAPFEKDFERVAYSSDIYPITYVPNFHELEYAIPVANGAEAVRQIRKITLEQFPKAEYPLEYRFTAGDGAWLSPFYERDSVTVSVSGEPGLDYWNYLLAVDRILRDYDARPHWGKMHFLTGEDVVRLYPRAGDFRRLRRQLDPEGFFLNEHLSPLLG
ncbi:MAG: D-arabinono-1,4-lactone oxidase [Lautropia sp.]|nr:D-arabinono-1,4-lactone oxidase [Lautropia sp.]